ALRDVVAFLEVDGRQRARDLRMDLHRLDRLDGADDLNVERDALLSDGGHCNGHGRLRAPAAARASRSGGRYFLGGLAGARGGQEYGSDKSGEARESEVPNEYGHV